MALATAAAAVAGGSAIAAYLDGRYHLAKDIRAIARAKYLERQYAEAVKAERCSLWFIFVEKARLHPDATVIWTRQKEWTWKETLHAACRYSRFFLSQGVRPAHGVAFYLQNSAEFFLAWLGLLQLGCWPAMINYNLEDTALVHCLKVSGANLVLVDDDKMCRARIEKDRTTIEHDLSMKIVHLDAATKQEIATLSAEQLPDEYAKTVRGYTPVSIFYTSGTTGLPKGCAFLTERTLLGGPHLFPPCESVPGPGGDRWYSPMPLYHGTGGITTLGVILSGTSIAVPPRFSVSNFWKDIHDSNSSVAIYVGETVRYLLNAPPGPYDRDHRMRCVFGNGLRPDVWERFKDRFNVPIVCEFFNSSEGMFSLVNWNSGPFTSACVGHHGAILRYLFRKGYVPVAIDYETGDIWRDPKTGLCRRQDYSEGGEILVALFSEAGFQGYWGNPDATNKKFARDVLRKGDLYYRTGDALRRSEDGKWYFMDRLGDTFRWKSENVATAEVSEVLGQYPGVVDANVYGVLVPQHDGRAGCAALLINSADKDRFNYNDLVGFARSKLPAYAVPVFLRIVTSSSISHNNKQNKVPLRKEGVEPGKIGTEAPDGKDDYILWTPPKSKQFVEFTQKDWKQLENGGVML